MPKPADPKERKAFKDWFDKAAAESLALQVAGSHRKFDQSKFVSLATNGLSKLEFSARVLQFSNSLAATLPPDVPKALEILTASLPEGMPDCDYVTDGWLQWPIGQYIADHGLEHLDESMVAMIELTKRFSSEFAVRPFVEKHPQEIFRRLTKLASDPNPHVRRWCSEAVRPRLPWGKKLKALVADPSPILPILHLLKDDNELYVRRSVANNLNDIAKDHPALVVQTCSKWKRKTNANRDWVIKHAMRTLIKDGNSGALEVIGFGAPDALSAKLEVSPSSVSVGDSVALSAVISNQSNRSQQMMVDFVVHYVRKSGEASGKVFKWTTTSLDAGDSVRLEKKHSMRKTTIRALYPGRHVVELQINGMRVAKASFLLSDSFSNTDSQR